MKYARERKRQRQKEIEYLNIEKVLYENMGLFIFIVNIIKIEQKIFGSVLANELDWSEFIETVF